MHAKHIGLRVTRMPQHSLVLFRLWRTYKAADSLEAFPQRQNPTSKAESGRIEFEKGAGQR